MSLLDLIVEQRIEAAIAAGEFEDLPGAGKPLVLDDDKLVPEELAGRVPDPQERGFRSTGGRRQGRDRSVEALLRHATDDASRRRAVIRLALLEARLEAEGRSLPRGPYRDRLLDR